MAGYSGTRLPQKLGIKEGARVVVAGAPHGFIESTLGALPAGAMIAEAVSGDTDVAILFVRSMAELHGSLPGARAWMAPAGGLWIAWPKKASGIATDLGENAIREAGLEAGLVDNKVCAIDDTWSGLRFVFRLRDRPPRP